MELFLLFAAIGLGVLIVFNLTSTVQRRRKSDLGEAAAASRLNDAERHTTDSK